jgi:hypothetical protein
MFRTISARMLMAIGFSWLALVTGPVQAAGTASYYLAIAEDNDVAHLSAKAATGNQAAVDMLHMAEMYAMWKTQQELLAFRDYPYFEITNTSTDPTAGITHFRIAIDPTRAYNFDTVFYIESSPGITYAINGLDTIQNGLRSDYIDLTFTGFTADKFFRFRSDIDNDGANVNFFTDYRTVLTDAGGGNPATNALVNVDMSTGASFSDRIPGSQLAPGAPFYTGTNFQTYHGGDMVQPYVIGGVSVIPEPSTWVALTSMLGAGGLLYRRRRLVVSS